MAEHDFSSRPRLRLPGRGIGPVFIQENLGVCQAEAVDGLLHIPHQEAILLL